MCVQFQNCIRTRFAPALDRNISSACFSLRLTRSPNTTGCFPYGFLRSQVRIHRGGLPKTFDKHQFFTFSKLNCTGGEGGGRLEGLPEIIEKHACFIFACRVEQGPLKKVAKTHVQVLKMIRQSDSSGGMYPEALPKQVPVGKNLHASRCSQVLFPAFRSTL